MNKKRPPGKTSALPFDDPFFSFHGVPQSCQKAHVLLKSAGAAVQTPFVGIHNPLLKHPATPQEVRTMWKLFTWYLRWQHSCHANKEQMPRATYVCIPDCPSALRRQKVLERATLQAPKGVKAAASNWEWRRPRVHHLHVGCARQVHSKHTVGGGRRQQCMCGAQQAHSKNVGGARAASPLRTRPCRCGAPVRAYPANHSSRNLTLRCHRQGL